ncbi:rho GTPase-activating protein 6-like isoform X2 [Montipora foliosa]|uniref:rho GTPase-activating protein 6-like isoform X2 n=2 Tax=Montipora foliosa TaxID=591990 RepID=UPI0035F10E09
MLMRWTPEVWREMMPEVDSFNPFTPSQNRSGPPRSFSQYYEGMQEKLSPTSPQKERFFNKTWRNRLKVIPNAGNALWIPQVDFSWSSVEGRKVQLTKTPLSSLSEAECIALQRVAQTRLKLLNLKSHVTIPKDPRFQRKTLKRALSWKPKSPGSGQLDKDKENGVFAIPLHKAVTPQGPPDCAESKKSPKNVKEGTPLITPSTASAQEVTDDSLKMRRDSSGSSLSQSSRSSTEISNHDSGNKSSKDTPSESTSWKSRLIDALTLLSSSASASYLVDRQSALSSHSPQVPPIVLQAIEHLKSNGLHVLGIFRVGGSKKRLKQMRDQFDSGEKTEFTSEDDNPHDVAALFKEYFRDLPEPLLTRDLYSAFLETQTFENQNMQITALSLLCCLLPIPNRDTLKVLLEFLAEVAQCSEDTLDENGVEVAGNKMNSKNLAIIIGPNILHKVKGQHHDFLVEDKARADERKEVIDVVQDMIEHHKELFEISAEMHHEVLLQLLDGEPEIVDYILRRKLLKTHGTSSDMEDDLFTSETEDKNQTSMRGRFLSASAVDRPRGPNGPYARDANWRGRHPGGHHMTRSSSDRTHFGVGFPIRSYSLNQEEARHYRDHLLNRQISSPDDSLSPGTHNYFRQNKRKMSPMTPAVCRYDGSEEPPSPALSSRSHSVSYSSYSTPPSSPSGSGAYVSADSNSSSPLPGRAYVEDDTPAITEWTFQTEIDVELTREGDMYSRDQQYNQPTFTLSDWQLENWFQWESLTQQNSSQKDFLEQETLV